MYLSNAKILMKLEMLKFHSSEKSNNSNSNPICWSNNVIEENILCAKF